MYSDYAIAIEFSYRSTTERIYRTYSHALDVWSMYRLFGCRTKNNNKKTINPNCKRSTRMDLNWICLAYNFGKFKMINFQKFLESITCIIVNCLIFNLYESKCLFTLKVIIDTRSARNGNYYNNTSLCRIRPHGDQ